MAFRIWQVKPEHIAQYGFRSADDLCGPYLERGISRELYACVYTGHDKEAPCLDELFLAFNPPHPFPPDYPGRSMSVGDLVEYVENGELWYCDSIGWAQVRWEDEDE